jgi:hypothetical protein
MKLASIVCAWLADRIVSSKEKRPEHECLQDEIDELKREICELKGD